MDIQNNRPMSYDCSKILLQYLEANTRFHLSNRAPSIRKREKLVPLKIHSLEFYPFEFVVNKTKYKLGTYRKYPVDAEVLRGHQIENLKGGISHDLDEYGFIDSSDKDVVTPGDIIINDGLGVYFGPTTDAQADRIESQLEVFKWILAKRSGQEMDPLDKNHQDYFLVDQMRRASDEFLQQHITEVESSLAPFRCRRSGLQRPYTTSVQLTVTSPDGKSQIWRKPSVDPVQNANFKLHEAQKQLADFLFGNRTSTVCVENFNVGLTGRESQMTVRLPPNFQIRIRNLVIPSNAPAVCDAIQAIVHDSSYPIKRFQTCKNNIHLLDHPTIVGARKLVFLRYSYFLEIQEFLPFQNHNIYMGYNRFTPDEHIRLLRNWIESRREIGASFISKLEKEATILDIFAQAKEQLDGFDDGERCVKIPMTNFSQIKVSYKRLKKRGKRFTEWMLIIKVVAV